MHYSEIIALAGLGFGAILGLIGLVSPDRAAAIVRLQPDLAKPGGYTEFRATYGGLFLFTHLMALLIVLHASDTMGLMAILPVAAGWFGAAAGRIVAMGLDRSKGGNAKIVPIWMGTELALGLAIAAPILQFVG